MKIEFYEEFPTKKNLEKLKLIKFKTKVFVATKSLKEFKKLEKQIKRIKSGTQVAYWPIVKNSYYISPFSNTQDLIEIFKELETIKNPLLIDIELPLNKFMIFKNFFFLSKNKKIIKSFLEKNKKRITATQQPIAVISKLGRLIGLNYNINHKQNPMFYTSLLPKFILKKYKKALKKIKNKKHCALGLGTITTGILGDEPILSPENLKKDLEFVKQTGFNKVIIFRLGGLNKEYVKVINKYTKRKV